jgi:hypothetical protein
LQYFNRSSRYATTFRYRPATRTQRTWNKVTGSQYRQNRSYEGTGKTMRGGYQPNIKYGSGMPRRGRTARYGFGR